MLRSLLLLFVWFALLGGGGALADGPWTSWDNYTAAIRGVVRGSTLDEVIQWSDRQFARRAAVGRYVRWGGTIVIGSALVYAALNWFYNELRRQTGTPLDDLYGPLQRVGYVAPSFPCGSSPLYIDGYWYCPNCAHQWSVFNWNWPCSQLNDNAQYALQIAPSRYASLLSGFDPNRYDWVLQVFSDTFRIDIYPKRRSLEEILQSSPEARQALRDQVVGPYIDAHPIGSPSSPYPGVQLIPVPNPNQWTDNPFTRPDIDTDGDGWPDSIEWYEANRRGVPWPDVINDPQVYPDPNADPDGDGYTNQEELIVGTNPYDPASRPASRANPGTRTDTDGDGWPDDDEIRLGTDLNDPESKPEGEPPQREEGEDSWPGGPPPVRPDPVELPEVALEKPEVLPELRQERWQEFIESTRERLDTRFKQLRDTALSRIPFAFLNLVSWRTSVESSPCAFPFSIGQFQGQVDICSTPVWQVATAFRPILAGLVLVGFGFAFVRRSLDVQK